MKPCLEILAAAEAGTATPWRVDPEYAGDIQTADAREIGSVFRSDQEGSEWTIVGTIAASSFDEQIANTALIVLAVNHAAALAEVALAAEALRDALGGENLMALTDDNLRRAYATLTDKLEALK